MQLPNSFFRVALYVIACRWRAEEPDKFDTTLGVFLGMVACWVGSVTAAAIGDGVDRACAGEDACGVGFDRSGWSEGTLVIVILLFLKPG